MPPSSPDTAAAPERPEQPGQPGQPGRDRFVTACQQTLALGAVLAVLTPAAAVVSLDVVHEDPGTGQLVTSAATADDETAEVPQGEVDATVREVPLTSVTAGRPTGDARMRADGAAGADRLVSSPEPVTGYASIGLVWSADQPDPAGRIVRGAEPTFEVRTETDAVWSGWQPIEYHDEHQPEPEEARNARPGTDAVVIGDVDRVQVRIQTPGPAYRGLTLAVIDPGEAPTATEAPDIDTGTQDPVLARTTAGAKAAPAVTGKPKIFSRAQWGADESIRSKSSLRYHEIHAGFVHHTVNANGYTRDQVPSILRGIYAYHVKSRGWSDIGYNFLVDRFGRIWEGRAGGVDRPVVGAHTLGYNDYSFAMSAIGNFETAQPPAKMLKAYARLMAWKLALHGVNAESTKQTVGPRSFQAVSGHRDAGSTACPGRYLYAKLPQIRTEARALQQDWAGRERHTDLTGDGVGDLLVQRRSDGRAVILPLRRSGTAVSIGKAIETDLSLRGKSYFAIAGDWDRDGVNDIVWRQRKTGTLYLIRGQADGGFAEPSALATGFGSVEMLAAVGDVTGDGYPDLMGQPSGGSMRIYPGAGDSRLGSSYVAYAPVKGTRQVGIGRVGADGAPDVLIDSGSSLRVYQGNGPGGLSGTGASVSVDGRWLIGAGDVDGDNRADLLYRKRGTNDLVLLPGKGAGFGAPVPVTGSLKGYNRSY